MVLVDCALFAVPLLHRIVLFSANLRLLVFLGVTVTAMVVARVILLLVVK